MEGKRFNKKKIIESIIEPQLTQMGFRFKEIDRSLPAGCGWVYEREMEDCTQAISIETLYGEQFRIVFSSDIAISVEYYGKMIQSISGEKYERFVFKDKSEFTSLCLMFANYLAVHGEEELKKASTPIRPRMDESFGKYVFENHDELEAKGRRALELTSERPDAVIDKIQEKVSALQGRDFQDVKEELAELSAVWGATFISALAEKGEVWSWEWNESAQKNKNGTCAVRKANGVDATFPAHDIFGFWSKNHEHLAQNFKNDLQYTLMYSF